VQGAIILVREADFFCERGAIYGCKLARSHCLSAPAVRDWWTWAGKPLNHSTKKNQSMNHKTFSIKHFSLFLHVCQSINNFPLQDNIFKPLIISVLP
jgi:hypothetical protein